MIRSCCSGGVVTYDDRLLLHFDVDFNGGRHFDHANLGELYLCLMCGYHIPLRHDPLAQWHRIGDAEYVSYRACQQVPIGVEQQRSRKEEEHPLDCMRAGAA
jgi:hypothetical protein